MIDNDPSLCAERERGRERDFTFDCLQGIDPAAAAATTIDNDDEERCTALRCMRALVIAL